MRVTCQNTVASILGKNKSKSFFSFPLTLSLKPQVSNAFKFQVLWFKGVGIVYSPIITCLKSIVHRKARKIRMNSTLGQRFKVHRNI